MARMSQRYPQELRERALRLVAEVRDDYESEWKAIESVATKLGIGSTETAPARHADAAPRRAAGPRARTAAGVFAALAFLTESVVHGKRGDRIEDITAGQSGFSAFEGDGSQSR